ncbi:MAG TPA: hypothetical protein VK914_10355 [bacterium]|jgi:hypothetical protein|nr:hypothetical protein [bacterium]
MIPVARPDITIHPPLAVRPGLPTPAAPAAPSKPAVATAPVLMRPLSPPSLVFRSPALGGLFFNLPKPRSSFALPTLISPTATPNDQTLFDEPQSGGPQHYLPSYALATTGSGGQTQFAVSLSDSGQGYLLTVHLAESGPTGAQAGMVAEAPPTAYLLSATLPDRAESWNFTNSAASATGITLTMPFTDPGQRDAIYSAMTDPTQQAKLILRRTPNLALPQPLPPQAAGAAAPAQMYRQSPVAIDTDIPFVFDKNLDQNVFAGLTNAVTGPPGALALATAPYPPGGAKTYSYWRDSTQPAGQVYFLPDSYNVSRLATSPHTPALTVTTAGNDPATMSVNLAFLAVPVWDPQRIAAAAAPDGPVVAAFGTVTSFSILPAINTSLALNLPSADGSTSAAPVTVSNAVIDTANGVQGSVTLSLSQFQEVYEAIFETPCVLLVGQVNVTVNQVAVAVPFSGRVTDFVGELLDTAMTYDPSQNQATLTATNGIESPIHVSGQPLSLVNKGAAVQASVVSLNPSLPADLQALPAAAPPASAVAPATGTRGAPAPAPSVPGVLTAVFQLGSGAAVGPSTSVQVDPSQISVKPDSDAIWNAIVQNQVVGTVQKQITLQLPAEVFPAPAPSPAPAPAAGATAGPAPAPSAAAPTAPNNPLLAVQVVFTDGQTATFTPSMTATDGLITQTIGLDVDLAEYVLGSGDGSNYSYQVNTVTAAGIQSGAWTTTNVDDLFVTLGG